MNMASHFTLRRSATMVAPILLAAAAPGPALAAPEPAALAWTSALTVRDVKGVDLQDADFSGQKVAITWQEPGGGTRKVGIRTSVNSGTSFGSAVTFPGARQSAVDICGSRLEAVYARKSGASWGIERAVGNVAGGSFVTRNVAVGPGLSRHPDIACAGGRVFVTWFHREGTGDRLYVSHARRSGGPFASPRSLGVDDETFFGRSLAVAGVADTAYVVFTRSDGKLRLKRWLVGAGPDFPVLAAPTQVIAQGTPGNSAAGAVIAAAGNKVAVAWFKCGGLFAKISNDRGLTWGPARKLLEHQACWGDFGASQRSIAIRGDRIVVTYLAFGIESPGWVGIISTTNDFAPFDISDQKVANRSHDEHLVGFLTAGSTTKLAAAFDPGRRVRFRREQ
jgi:hypothetical protein